MFLVNLAGLHLALLSKGNHPVTVACISDVLLFDDVVTTFSGEGVDDFEISRQFVQSAKL